jgi:CRP/FNR family transcriptional regulator, cyclic AMP receptor protein
MGERRDRTHRIAKLRAIPFVAGCTRKELERIDRLGTAIDLRAGTRLTREGGRERECFAVLHGLAVASHADRPLGTIGAGSFAGEMSLLGGSPRNATVVAHTPMRVVAYTDRELEELLRVAPAVAAGLGELVAEREAVNQLTSTGSGSRSTR